MAHKIKHIPSVIIQGRYDVVCPMKSAWDLYKKMPSATFVISQNSGHSMLEKDIQEKLIQYTDKFASY